VSPTPLENLCGPLCSSFVTFFDDKERKKKKMTPEAHQSSDDDATGTI